MRKPAKALSQNEFVSVLALMISIMALSVDSMIPALDIVGKELGVSHPNHVQYVVLAMFFGFAFGQLIYGPISDRFGRKPLIFIGFGVFMAGCILSMTATSFDVMIVGRILQGLGAAGGRSLGVAIVRDLYKGREMARIMSFVMAVFILMPLIGPPLGQIVMDLSNWRMIFGMLLAISVVAVTWFGLRQPETLAVENRREFTSKRIFGGVREAFSYRAFGGYTFASGMIYGAFFGYLSSAQQIFQDAYDTGNLFAYYFGAASLAFCVGNILNSQLVVRYGMVRLLVIAIIVLAAGTAAFAPMVIAYAGVPPFWAFYLWVNFAMFCIALIFANVSALAMEPVGHMAGLASAVTGSLNTFISLFFGWIIGTSYSGDIVPVITGFAILSLSVLPVVWWIEKGRKAVEA